MTGRFEKLLRWAPGAVVSWGVDGIDTGFPTQRVAFLIRPRTQAAVEAGPCGDATLSGESGKFSFLFEKPASRRARWPFGSGSRVKESGPARGLLLAPGAAD